MPLAIVKLNASVSTLARSGTPRLLSPRLGRLLDAWRARQSEAERLHPGSRVLFDDAEAAVFTQARLAAYRETAGQPAILRRVRVLECFAEQAVITVQPDDWILGSQCFCPLGYSSAGARELAEAGYAQNPGHIIHDYAGLLTAGVDGLRGRIADRQRQSLTPEEAMTLAAFVRALAAFSRFIERHADAADALSAGLDDLAAHECHERAAAVRRLAHAPPVTLLDALQLVWFMQVFLHAENPSAAISFGRLDLCLWPFLASDLEHGRTVPRLAAEQVAAFFLRCGEGEESQNLTVGGVGEDGRDATNPLSVLMLCAMAQMRLPQPSLSVRIHPGSPADFIEAACELAAAGTGQPGFINDEAAIPGLQAAGVPIERARDYGIVGCYEAAPQGDSYPNTVGNCAAGSVPTLPRMLVDFLGTAAARDSRDFRAFLESWFGFVETAYRAAVAGAFQAAWDHWRDRAPSPFSSAMTRGCIASARTLEAGGATYNLFGVNMLGLGTTVDSLHAVQEQVFDRRALTMADLVAALAADYPDESLRQRLSAVPGRYGTDSPATNALAAEVSERLARMVLDSRMLHGVRPYPAFFRFTADVWDHPYATPDGRRAAANLSYGCGPGSACGAAPTAILASAAHVAHRLCACGTPLALSLPVEDLAGAAGAARLQGLVLGYFAAGGFHVHVNARSADELRAAKADPAHHGDLLIRISGLSARFTALPAQLQDALIERAAKGV